VQIIAAITEQGLSIEAVALKAGVDPEHLALLESADRCSFDDVKKLCAALGLSLPAGCKKSAPS
jgi:lambda repressor-like predicted transcriptional regulator